MNRIIGRGIPRWRLIALAGLAAVILAIAVFSFRLQHNAPPGVSPPATVPQSKKASRAPVAPSANSSKSAPAERSTGTPASPQQGVRPSSAAGTSPWLIVVLLILALTTALATATNFYLFRRQRRDGIDGDVAAPEEPGDWSSRIDTSVGEFQAMIARNNERQRAALLDLAEQVRRTNADVANLLETTATLRNALDERDQEIRRLRQGYDAEVFRRFLSRFIRVRQAVEDFATGENGQDEAFHQLARLLDDAFEECGVEKFEPPVGADYREAQGVADNPRRMKARRAAEAFRIAEVVEPGYRLRSGGRNAVIVPAKVAIYIP